MYSDGESDDFDSENATCTPAKTISRPYLRVFDEDEVESTMCQIWRKRTVKDGEISEDINPPYHKFYRILRPGLPGGSVSEINIKGSLDLTGRHPSRFNTLHGRWNNYLADFLPLMLGVNEVTKTFVYDHDNEAHKEYPEYVFSNPTPWENFRKKWRIPGPLVVDFSLLYRCTLDLLQIIGSNPVPCFQKLHLTDLPTELLDIVFMHASLSEARLLSATSRSLNEIGRRYIFGTRTLRFNLPLDIQREVRDEEDPLEYLAQLARSERTKVLSSTEFLLGRPDLTSQMRTVSMANCWQSSAFAGTIVQGFELSQIESEFLAPIHREFTNILAVSRNLVSVTLSCLPLTKRSLECLSNLHSLHSLDLRYSKIPSDVQSSLQSHNPVLSVYNLCLWISLETLSIWLILPFCHHLRTLSVFSPNGFDIPTPPPIFWSTCPFFPTLQRLSLEHLDSACIPSLAASFQNVSAVTGLQLTHFKLHTRRGIHDSDALLLLDSLGDAPIKALVLNGLSEVEPPLFDRIIELYEQTLVALTLIRRANSRQLRTRPIVWPRPTWEYAQYLSGLTNLEHFCWNSVHQFTTPTTSILLDFEQNFPVDPSGYIDDEKDHNIRSVGWDTFPFAANCPNLKTFTNEDGFASTILVSRSNTGFISTELLCLLGPTVRKRCGIDQWTTSMTYGHGWLHILPSTSDTGDV